MARPVSVRTSYREDGAHLIRFEGAILRDVDLPEDWKKEFARHVHGLAIRCLEADEIKNRMKNKGTDKKLKK